MNTIKLNLNNEIIIYPSNIGWIKIHEIISNLYGVSADKLDDEIKKRTTEDNGYRDQLWKIIEELYPLIFNGSRYLLKSEVNYIDNFKINHMNITKPNEMSSGISKFEEAINKFEAQLKNKDKDQDYYHLVIEGEYNRDVCDEIEKAYTDAGWNIANCKTSSEKGERGGLTGLQLWRI